MFMYFPTNYVWSRDTVRRPRSRTLTSRTHRGANVARNSLIMLNRGLRGRVRS